MGYWDELPDESFRREMQGDQAVYTTLIRDGLETAVRMCIIAESGTAHHTREHWHRYATVELAHLLGMVMERDVNGAYEFIIAGWPADEYDDDE